MKITPESNITNTELVIPNVDPKVKHKILIWVWEIGLVKKQIESDVFPRYCRNGVLFSDLLNELAGRSETIKGIFRNPSTIA